MTPDVVRKGVAERLERLGVAKVDLLQFHWWTFEHPAWLDALHEMAKLREEGLIGAIGVTNFDAAHLALALADGIPIVSNQVSFSLVDRRAAGALSEVCKNKGVKLLAYGTLCGGFLSEKWLGKPEPTTIPDWSRSKYKRFIDAAGGWSAFQGVLAAAGQVAKKHKVSISNVATRWVLDHPVRRRLHHRRAPRRERASRRQSQDVRRRAGRRGPGAAGAQLRRHQVHPRRLRRRISQAALPHRLRRSQPPSEHGAQHLLRHADAASARGGSASRRAACGSRSPATAARSASRTASWSRARPRPTAPTAAWRRAMPARRPPTSWTRSPPPSPRSAASMEDVVRTRIYLRDGSKWEPVVARPRPRVRRDHARQHADRGRQPDRRLRGRDRGRSDRRGLGPSSSPYRHGRAWHDHPRVSSCTTE